MEITRMQTEGGTVERITLTEFGPATDRNAAELRAHNGSPVAYVAEPLERHRTRGRHGGVAWSPPREEHFHACILRLALESQLPIRWVVFDPGRDEAEDVDLTQAAY